MGSSHVIPSATLQRCNTRSGSQFARLWQQLQHFPHRIAEDDLRGPTSTGLSIDEIELLACQPAEKGEGGILRQSPKRPGFLRDSRSFFSLVCIPSVYPWQPGKREPSPNLWASLGPIRRSRSPSLGKAGPPAIAMAISQRQSWFRVSHQRLDPFLTTAPRRQGSAIGGQPGDMCSVRGLPP